MFFVFVIEITLQIYPEFLLPFKMVHFYFRIRISDSTLQENFRNVLNGNLMPIFLPHWTFGSTKVNYYRYMLTLLAPLPTKSQ